MRFVKFIFIMAMLLFITVCQKQNQGKQIDDNETSQAKWTIALVMKTLTNPFFITMERGAREAQKDFEIDLIVKTGSQETAISQQIDIIRKLINDKVDAIVIAPASSIELVPILAKAQAEGIKIVNIDNKLDKEASLKYNLKDVPFISVDNEQGAYLSVKEMIKDVTNPAKAVIIEGITSAKNGIDRKKGAIRAFNEKENIEIVAMETANWKIDEAYQVFESIWQKNPDIDLVFCANDMMALGVVQFIQENDLSDIKISAFDNINEIKPFLKSGLISVTVDQQGDIQGYRGIETAYKLLNNEIVSEIEIETILVTE